MQLIDYMEVSGMIEGVTYGARFRQLRERLGFTQADVAARLFGNRSLQGNVAAIERTAGRIPRPDTIGEHAAALQCAVSDLLTDVDDLWIDRARRGDYDGGRAHTLERRPAVKRRAGSR